MKKHLILLFTVLGIVSASFAQKDSTIVESKIPDEVKYKAIFDFLASRNDTQLFSSNSWRAINDYVYDINSREFKFVLKNRDKFAVLYGDSAVNEKISRTYLHNVLMIANDTAKSKESQFLWIRAEISNGTFPKKDELLAKADLFFYNNSHNWPKFAELAASGTIEKYYWDRPESLSKISKVFYDHINDESLLKRAIKWSERSVELVDLPESNLIYAQLLFKIGEVEKSIKVQSHALDLAYKAHKANVKEYEEALEKFKQQE